MNVVYHKYIVIFDETINKSKMKVEISIEMLTEIIENIDAFSRYERRLIGRIPQDTASLLLALNKLRNRSGSPPEQPNEEAMLRIARWKQLIQEKKI